MRRNSSRWSKTNLEHIIPVSRNIRHALELLGLKAAGGNYDQFRYYIRSYSLDTSHFTGQGWSKNKKIPRQPIYSLEEILVRNSSFQSHKLRKRLISSGVKLEECEEYGWNKKSVDGRIPLELDHINGDHTDNRLENLRILCPNCHSLKPTHRGGNIRLRRRDGEIGRHAALKTL